MIFSFSDFLEALFPGYVGEAKRMVGKCIVEA